jgi:hypothetical protein
LLVACPVLGPNADLECVRIVLVAETFLPATNGVVNCVLHIAKELAAERTTQLSSRRRVAPNSYR